MKSVTFEALIAIICLSSATAYSFPPTFLLSPTRASGIGGQDWIVNHESRVITLRAGGQSVILEAYIREFGPTKNLLVAAAGLDCQRFQADTGESATQLTGMCKPGGFDEICMGIDTSRKDYALAGEKVIVLCSSIDDCPDSPKCSGVTIVGRSTVDLGFDYYVATFVLDIPPTSNGEFVIQLDEHDDVTFYRDAHAGATPIEAFLPATIRVDPTAFSTVPTTSAWGLLVLAMLLATVAKVTLRRVHSSCLIDFR